WIASAAFTTWLCIHNHQMPEDDIDEDDAAKDQTSKRKRARRKIERRKGMSGHKLWVIVLLKDAFIGLGSVAMVFLSTSGVFNTCSCWSAWMWNYSKGTPNEAVVPLNTADTYNDRTRSIYSLAVAICIGVQILFFACVIWPFKYGIEIVRRT